MPTIKDLPLALVAADGDLLPISQGGLVRRVSRAQFLAGMQPALAIQSGALFGRSSAGVGGAERIGVGPNLRLVDGTLSAASPFSVAGLPGGVTPGIGDLVGVAQGGQDAALPYGAFMAGLANVPGINLSAQLAQVPGGVARSLADWAADAMPAEAFGALGDGHADDTAALGRAVASGRPVRLGPRTYILRGQWSIGQAATLIGVPGQTVLLRVAGDGPAAGAFVNIDGPAFTAMGVTFDAGTVPGESWGVLVTPRCTQTLFDACVFQGARGSSLGSGLVIQGRDNLSNGGGAGSSSRHRVIGCEARNNQVHGIWIQAASGALVEGCSAHGNGAYGICLDFNDPAFQQTVRHGRVLGCEAWGNARGISVGNFNETNAEPPRWGHAHPDAVAIVVAGNSCHDNSSYGIAVAGRALSVVGNDVSGNGNGLLVNAAQSRIAGNVVSGPGPFGPTYFGIDAGGCIDCDVSGNLVQGCSVGINPGGSRGVRVADNQLLGNIWGITAYNIETDGRSLADGGQNFGMTCEGLTIEGNRIVLQGGSGGGIYLLDAPQGVVVARNAFFGGDGGSPSQALWAHTDSVTLRDNTWNNQARVICNPVNLGSVQQIQVPDMLDQAMVTSAGLGVQSIMGAHQATVAGQIGFVRLQAGGSGYTQASVAITGAGTGAQAIAHIRDGAVLGIALLNAGSGYGVGAGVAVVITGDGQGAMATATVGLPVTDERRVRLHCNCAVRFQRVGSAPFQDNWTGADILVPAATAVDWAGTWGGWQALAFAPADYLAPTGDGGLVLRTANGAGGDLTLRPSGPGRLRIGSDNEPWGFVSTLGRGSPEGVVTAPPGSDYRNLDGGAGATLWLKRSGDGAIGWAAIG